jgi:hypothetical protein
VIARTDIPRIGIARDVLIVACGISAGIHGALAPEHFAEGMGAGIGFVAAAVGLGALAVALTLRPPSAPALVGSALLFAGLIVSYVLAITSGLPVLHPEPEPVEGLALVTKAIEAVGLFAALHLLRPRRSGAVVAFPTPKGTLT